VQGNTRYLRFFNHEIHEQARKFSMGVAALTDEPALAKFLCAKIGFTQLRRRRYGAPAARRHGIMTTTYFLVHGKH
jgi:hypothetical protein